MPVSFAPWTGSDPLSLAEIRLNALERMTRLVEQGTMSLSEFRVEKALIVQLTSPELLLTEIAPVTGLPVLPADPIDDTPERGPSLVSRVGPLRLAGLFAAGVAGFLFMSGPNGLAATLGHTLRNLVA